MRERLIRSLRLLEVPIVGPKEVLDFDSSRGDSLLLLRGTHIYEYALLRSLCARASQDLALVRTGPVPFVAAAILTFESRKSLAKMYGNVEEVRWSELSDALPHLTIGEFASYDPSLRKIVAPDVFDPELTDPRIIENRLLGSSEKGTNDWVSVYLHSDAENWVTRILWKYPFITPNAVTFAAIVGSMIAVVGFFTGHFFLSVVWGNLQGVWDGVDGKLARTTLRFSKFGSRLDHIADQIYEPLWYLGAGCWLASATGDGAFSPAWMTALLLASYGCDRVITGTFAAMHDVELHDYRPADRWIRMFGARRNNNLALLLPFAISANFSLGFNILALYSLLTALCRLFRFGWIAYRRLPSDVGISSPPNS